MNLMDKYRNKRQNRKTEEITNNTDKTITASPASASGLSETAQTASCEPLDGQEAAAPGNNSQAALTAPAKAIERPRYTIIYSKVLDDCLLLVETDKDRDILFAQGTTGDVIFTHDEIKLLKGQPFETARANFMIKKTFPSSKIEE